MLDAAMVAQLEAHLTKIVRPVDLVASLDDGPTFAKLHGLLRERAGRRPPGSTRRGSHDRQAPARSLRSAP